MIAPCSIRAFAGVDGGATKTSVRVIDVEGRLIGEGTAGPGSLTLCPEKAARNCREALQQAVDGSGLDLSVCKVVFGLAGHRQTAKRLAFEQALADVGALEVISDGYAALLGAHQGAPGAIVIAGTGSVALGLDVDGKVIQVGGYGPVVGDEGSGNWLGRRAVRAALTAMDDAAFGGKTPPPLSLRLIDQMGGDHEAILDWIANADATRFASLVPMIVEHEASGDRLAHDLLDAAAKEASRLIQLIGRQGEVQVSLLGGLAATLTPRLPPAIRSNLSLPADDPAGGALRRARDLAPSEVYG